MSFPPVQNNYTANTGLSNGKSQIVFPFTTAPSTSSVNYPIGAIGIVPNSSVSMLIGFSTAGGTLSANWIQLSDSDGPVESVVGTANQITVTTAAGVATISLPSAITTPGSLTTTTFLTVGNTLTVSAGGAGITGNSTVAGSFATTGGSGTITASLGITSTLGDITTTNGNFVSSTAGKGLSFNATTASGAASGPVVLNTRTGKVTFTTVSIAAAADLTLTMTNSAITSSSTQVIYSLSGATTGSALSVKSVTAGSGTIAFVITNGTGATTTTADISITFIVVN